MTPDAFDLAALVERLGDLLPGGRPPRLELLCGPGVIMWLRILTPEHDPSFPWSQTPPFTGIPLIHAPELGRGEWELRENDVPVESGRFDLPEPPDFSAFTPPLVFAPPPEPPPFSMFDRLAWRRFGALPPIPPGLSSFIRLSSVI